MDPIADLDGDPALAAAVLEIESHLADGGWDQPARLYALVDTAQLVRREPALASAMGLDASSERGLAHRGGAGPARPRTCRWSRCWSRSPGPTTWPVAPRWWSGWCCRRRPTSAIPEDPESAQQFALEHPDRQEVRIVAGATRHGATYCALRLRAHDDDQSVVGGIDLVPGLLALLGATLSDEKSRRAGEVVSELFDEEEPRTTRAAGAEAIPGADHHRVGPDRGVLRDHDVRVGLHRPALVPVGRLRPGLQHAALDQDRPVRGVRRRDGRRRRRQHVPGLPLPPALPAGLARADRPGSLPRRGHADPDLAAAGRLGGDRPVRRRLGRWASGAPTCCGATPSPSAPRTRSSTRTSATTSSTCRGSTTWSTSRWRPP